MSDTGATTPASSAPSCYSRENGYTPREYRVCDCYHPNGSHCVTKKKDPQVIKLREAKKQVRREERVAKRDERAAEFLQRGDDDA